MLTLQTRNGPVNARVFVKDNNREIGVVLERDGKTIDAMTFNTRTLRSLKTECMRWLSRRGLDDKSRVAMIDALKDSFGAIKSIRRHGEDVSQDWLGSRNWRRIPEIERDDAVM